MKLILAYGTKSLDHFINRFHRPLALLIHHLTLLSSAVQVRSLYPAWSSWLAWLGFLLYLWKVILFDHQPPEQRARYDCHSLDTVQDFFIKLGIKPGMHLWKIGILSLNNVIFRPTKIMNRTDKNWAHF